ncbi:MAG: glycosyltransferase family 4 protein [Anaerolineae bacterium]|jgi:glycosyltransferase involved in cell wall biosynthesis|nr:glycosyltransferase family 4 protein [Anaerolineae bacterium]MDH7474490.1 glycosyltransferase family 4 protein [Anaerolineae bacterium]
MAAVNLLAVSLDATLACKPEGILSDEQQRQLKYATILRNYYLIARVLGSADGLPVQMAKNFWVYPVPSRNRLTFIPAAVRVGSELCRNQPIDVISTQDPFATGLVGYILKRRFGIPLSLQFAGDMVDNPYWLRERRIYPLMNVVAHWLIRRADTFRVVSTREKQKLMAMGVPEERIWNLGWITDFSRFIQADGTAIRARYLRGGISKLVLFAGRLGPQKDLPNLLRSAVLVLHQHPDVLFLLVGSGREELRARRLAEELGVTGLVVFAGAVPYAQMPAYFAACDLFVLPSVYEGNARVLAEAAAAAKPVVATDVSGTQDTVIDGETGYIVPIGQPEVLAQGMIRLLDDPARAAEMGRRAREHVLALYDEQRLLSGFAELWEATARLRKMEGQRGHSSETKAAV